MCCVVVATAVLLTSSAGAGVELGFKSGMVLSKLPMDHTLYVETARFPRLWSDHTDSFASGHKRGFCLGAFVAVPVSERFDLQFEINWAHRGGVVEGVAQASVLSVGEDWVLKEIADLQYIEFPLLLRIRGVRIGPLGTRFLVGPYADLRVKATDKLYITWGGVDSPRPMERHTDSSSAELANLDDRADYGLVVGFQLEWTTGKNKLFLDFRYAVGFGSDFKNTTAADIDYWDYEALFYSPARPNQIDLNDARTGDASGFKNRSFYLTAGFSFNL